MLYTTTYNIILLIKAIKQMKNKTDFEGFTAELLNLYNIISYHMLNYGWRHFNEHPLCS